MGQFYFKNLIQKFYEVKNLFDDQFQQVFGMGIEFWPGSLKSQKLHFQVIFRLKDWNALGPLLGTMRHQIWILHQKS